MADRMICAGKECQAQDLAADLEPFEVRLLGKNFSYSTHAYGLAMDVSVKADNMLITHLNIS